MTEKFLYVRFGNQELWKIPISVIAFERANYFDKRDTDTTFQEEFDYAMSDNSEITDWAFNNMNWVDVKDHAVKVEEESRDDYKTMWVQDIVDSYIE